MKRLVTLTLVVVAGAVWWVSPREISASTYLFNFHYFPIVSNASGKGGSRWVTEVSITNPQLAPITITHRLSYAGGYLERTQTIPAGGSVRWDNYLQEFWGLTGNAALYLKADPSFNGWKDSDCLAFAASVKIANVGGASGSFNMDVPSLDVLADFLGRWPAYFTGVRNFGQPGVDGFRTNIGVWNIGATATLKATLYDALGNVRWQQFIVAERHKPALIPIPENVNVDLGAMVIDPMGQYVDAAVYLSIVDNKTSDGLVRTPQTVNPDDMLKCGGFRLTAVAAEKTVRPATPREADLHLERAFLGLESRY
ncbi:MAG: hypothetical protein ACP5NF_04805 [Thermoanaerobaculum sp.]